MKTADGFRTAEGACACFGVTGAGSHWTLRTPRLAGWNSADLGSLPLDQGRPLE